MNEGGRVRKGTRLAIVAVVLVLATQLNASSEAIRVEVGTPTLWTLEQAHYQLARQRQKNAGLETLWPSPERLDPNALHGSRLDQLRTLFSASVGFDSAAGATNSALLQRQDADVARRQFLIMQVDTLRSRSLQLTEQIAEITRANGTLDVERDADLIRSNTAEINALAAVRTEVNSQLAATEKELAATPATLGTLQRPQLPEASAALPDSALKSLIESKELLTRDPKLHASTVLDNFIQMQYELIVKQLALLRDDIGADNRLIFVELPVSIYTSDARQAENSVVRSEYSISNLSVCRSLAAYINELQVPSADQAAARLSKQALPDDYKAALSSCFPEVALALSKESANVLNSAPISRAYIESVGRQRPETAAAKLPEILERQSVSSASTAARVVDLIPRQSALNVNDVHDRVSGIRLAGLFTWLTGFGAKSSYERQREKFEQFVHQEIFASGHGKGTHRFGWTFGPNPGQKRIAPGVRNTFAALVVPRTAVGVELTMTACSYERKELPPTTCGVSQKTSLKIPTDQEGFFIRQLWYSTVPVGRVATVFVYGPHFSPQLAVLVNGVPLKQKLDLANDFTLTAPSAVPHGIQGDFEYVNQGLVVLRFSMGPDFSGTPRIALVTPQKAAEINRFELEINGVPGQQLANCGKPGSCLPMFNSLALRELRVIRVAPKAGDASKAEIRAHLLGSGFRRGDRIEVNGQSATLNSQSDTPAFHDITFDAPTADEWTVTLTQDAEIVRLPVRNPLVIQKKEGKATFVDAANGDPEKALVALSGGPFDASLDKVFVNTAEVKDALFSTSEISFTVADPPSTFAVSVRRAGSTSGVTWTFTKPPKKTN
jgi:hypothetical protein